jgi:hypothetical protein
MNDISNLVIRVTSTTDVLEADALIQSTGNQSIFSTPESRESFVLDGDVCFLVPCVDGSWRLQSHHLSDGINVDELKGLFGVEVDSMLDETELPPKLKPCPFCGSTDIKLPSGSGTQYEFGCDDCGHANI